MTNMTKEQASVVCADELARLQTAQVLLNQAQLLVEQARQNYEDAGGIIDDSTAWDINLVGGAALICLSNPASWIACGVGTLIGGAGIFASESDRQDEINSAQQALAQAEQGLALARSLWQEASEAANSCMAHHMLIVRPLPN